MRAMIGIFVLMAGAASASTYGPPKTIICPVGGEKFSVPSLMSYSTWGSLPDGQPTGSAMFPLPVPQCPGNGLPVYDAFDAATIAKLTPLVMGDAFRALRSARETPRYLMQWLQQRLGAPDVDVAWTLLQATWEAKGESDPARGVRYTKEYVDRAGALAGDTLDVRGLKARRVNALRELGRFDEAEAARQTLLALPLVGTPEDREQWAGWRTYLAKLAPAIARKDAVRTPIDMLSDRDQIFRCADAGESVRGEPALTTFETQFCADPAKVKAVEDLKQRRRGLSS